MARKDNWLPASVEDRIGLAKVKSDKLIDHLIGLIAMHEANRIIVYSDRLSSQIPRSYAANAFNLFQRSSHFFELLRLCAHWDPASRDRESIPTIVALIDHPDVMDALGEGIAASWQGSVYEPEYEPDVAAALAARDREFGASQRCKLVHGLRRAVALAKLVEASPRLRNVRNFRDKHLAHSLSETAGERAGTVQPPKHGDDVRLLRSTLAIARNLTLGVLNKDFDFNDSRRIATKNAHALWDACTFDVTQ